MTILYLHIGTEKTGTTSIQRFFDANRELLRRNGILYPTAPGHRNQLQLTVAAKGRGKAGGLRKKFGVHTAEDAQALRDRLAEALGEEVAGAGCPTVIMSNEHCSSRLHRPNEVRRLRDLLAPFFSNVKILVYIRRQDDFLLSTYSTSIKSGSTAPLHIPPVRDPDPRYDYWNLLSRWADVFGKENIVCRKYERPGLKADNIIDDFLDAVDIDPALPLVRPDPLNESLDARSLEFLRLFNEFVPYEAGSESARDNLVRLLSRRPEGEFLTLSPDQLAEFMARFRESNRKVATEYFGGELSGSADPLFAATSDPRARTLQATIAAEQAVEIAAWLWLRKREEIQRMEDRTLRRQAKAERQAAAATAPE